VIFQKNENLKGCKYLSILSNKKIAYLSLGCKVNSYETEAMKELLTSLGAITVDFREQADIYVVNTCTVTNVADRKSRQVLHRAKKTNPNALVVAVGCYVQEFYENHIEDAGIDLLIGNQRKHQIAFILENYFSVLAKGEKPDKVYVSEDKTLNSYEPLQISNTEDHTRAYMKIQDGCNQFCSYCIIPFARGRIQSREMESIKKEAVSLAEKGFQEIVLTGIHISSFGLDDCSIEEQKSLQRIDQRMPLIELIQMLSEISGIKRIRLGSLEPRIITEAFCQELAKFPKVCPHFHLSLQSGCDKTLKAMNRRYTTEQYYAGVCLLRTYFDCPGITTDLIVGFPGETKEDFVESMEFAKKVAFSKIHVFPYSRRKGTVADKMPNQVEDSEKKKREHTMLVQESLLARNYELSIVGKMYPVLLEEEILLDGKQYMIGHTPQYVMIAVETALQSGEVLEVTITEEKLQNYVLAKC